MPVLASEEEGLDHELQTSGQAIILPIACRNGEDGTTKSHCPLTVKFKPTFSDSNVHMFILIHRDPRNADSEGPGKGLRLCISNNFQELKLLDGSLNGKGSAD